MLLRNQVEWALHCCAILAQYPEHYMPTKDLAEFHGVPKEYLSKALQALAQAKLIEGTLGPNGGYRLSRDPQQISFLEVVEAIEGKRGTFLCTSIINNNPCLRKGEKSTEVCDVARVMYQADEAWRKELRSVSMAELVQRVVAKLPAEQLERSRQWFLSKR